MTKEEKLTVIQIIGTTYCKNTGRFSLRMRISGVHPANPSHIMEEKVLICKEVIC